VTTQLKVASSHRQSRNNVGALLNSTSEFRFLLSDFSIDFHAHDYFTTYLSLRTSLQKGQLWKQTQVKKVRLR
jgi:hypothetical protein